MVRSIDAKLKMLMDQMPDCWGCKDGNSVFMYANEALGNLLGLRHQLDIVGLTDADLPCDIQACVPQFRAQDREVATTGKSLKILDIHPYADGVWKACVFTKIPLRDDDGHVVGIIFHGADITSPNVLELGSLLNRMHLGGKTSILTKQGSYLINKNRDAEELTQRESEVLFFLLRGKNAKAIALGLGISHRTVEQHIEQLRMKFCACNKSELISHALEAGYLSRIPGSLFSRQLSVILREV